MRLRLISLCFMLLAPLALRAEQQGETTTKKGAALPADYFPPMPPEARTSIAAMQKYRLQLLLLNKLHSGATMGLSTHYKEQAKKYQINVDQATNDQEVEKAAFYTTVVTWYAKQAEIVDKIIEKQLAIKHLGRQTKRPKEERTKEYYALQKENLPLIEELRLVLAEKPQKSKNQ